MSYLEHIGVLGMRWGHRRAPMPDTSSQDHQTTRALRTKKVHELSNDELKKLTTRLQLEKQYRELTKQDISPGQKFVTELLTSHLKTELSSGLITLSKSMAPQVQAAIENKFKKG